MIGASPLPLDLGMAPLLGASDAGTWHGAGSGEASTVEPGGGIVDPTRRIDVSLLTCLQSLKCPMASSTVTPEQVKSGAIVKSCVVRLGCGSTILVHCGCIAPGL